MRYVRFMGEDEMKDYEMGATLVNHTYWGAYSEQNQSVGFCFFDDSVAPEERMEYLTGVVDMDVVGIFEAQPGKELHESYARYRDAKKDTLDCLDFFDMFIKKLPVMTIREYCTESYNREELKLVKKGRVKNVVTREIEWEE